MKNLLPITLIFLLSGLINCAIIDEKDDDEMEVPSLFDETPAFSEAEGSYSGVALEDNIEIGQWILLIYQGRIYGINSGADDEILLEGEVDADMISGIGTSTDGSDYTITFSGIISEEGVEDFNISGTWEDDETSGTFEGSRDQRPDGGYRGYAVEGENLAANFVMAIHDRVIYGVTTGVNPEVLLSGTVSPGGFVTGSGEGIDEDGDTFTVTFTGDLANDIMLGTWSDDESTGEFKAWRMQFN